MAASFYESLEEKSSRLFFCWVMGVGCWVLDDGWTEAAILYWANKAYRADNADSGQRLIRLIWLMLFLLRLMNLM